MPPKSRSDASQRPEATDKTYCSMCDNYGHYMFQCPQRIKKCGDIASDGSYIRQVTCFNCLEKHLLKNCPYQWMWWRICVNKRKFFECKENGTTFEGIRPESMGPPVATTPKASAASVYSLDVVGVSPWNDERMKLFADELSLEVSHVSFDEHTLTIAGVPDATTSDLISRIRNSKDPDGECWTSVTRRVGNSSSSKQSTNAPMNGTSQTPIAQSAFEVYTDNKLRALEETQSAMKTEISEVRSSVHALDAKVSSGHESMNNKLDGLFNGLLESGLIKRPTPPSGEPAPEPAPASNSSSSSAAIGPASTSAPPTPQMGPERMTVDNGETPIGVNYNANEHVWGAWGAGGSAMLQQVSIVSYGEQDSTPGYMVQLLNAGKPTGAPFFIESPHLSRDRESLVPSFDRCRGAKRHMTRNTSKTR